MKDKNISVQKIIFFLIIVTFGIILTMSYVFTDKKEIHFQYTEESVEDWEFEVMEEGHILQARHLITDDMTGKTVSFYVNDSYVDASIEGALIYHFGEKPRFGSSPGSYYHFIEIPSKTQGKELVIQIETVYPHKFLEEYSFRIGNTSDIVSSYLRDERFSIVINSAICLFGIIMCLLHFVESRVKIRRGRNFYLGLLSIIFVSWSNCSLFINQLLFQNTIFQYYLNYLSLFTLMLVFILYVEALNPQIKCNAELGIGVAAIITLTGLHFAGIMDFTESVRIFSVIGGSVLVLLAIRIIRYKKQSKVIVAPLLILVGFVLLDALDFVFRTTFREHSLLTKTGLVIYLIYSIYAGMKHMLKEMLLAKETAVLKKIAYLDNLTKMNNRYALERDLKEMELSQLSIVSLDLNNLKLCNDKFGHAAGDQFIVDASNILHEIYEKVYRVGGDEFVALLSNCNEAELFEKKKIMQEKIAEYNKALRQKAVLEIACGYASFLPGDGSYEDILKRADKEMYRDKKRLKER